MSNARGGYVIIRDDGHFYLGTIDRGPVFGHGESAAVFRRKAAAAKRARGLARLNQDHTFEAISEDEGNYA
jgi:hypothetical protein